MNLSETEITILPKHGDQRGNLSVAEQLKEVPFEIKRCFWMYDVPEGKGRGGHAHKTLKQFVIAMSGSFKIRLVTGKRRRPSFLTVRTRVCSSTREYGQTLRSFPVAQYAWSLPLTCSERRTISANMRNSWIIWLTGRNKQPNNNKVKER